ncbi:MAG: glycine cleavage system aminomethyltransferase GcvT [Deltaproteobacteria bacterium]|nr:glycine cleavage system aminomethyltransferase GcvT [Deltaproteobacteria bacterium]
MSEGNPASAALARTPLYDRHRAAGAKLVAFAGWDMPVSYRGILEEHRTVRSAAGLFDVSHMGEIEILGPQAAAACQRLTTNDVRLLADGHVQYTILCGVDGGVVDDVTLYRIDDQRYLFCVNAGNVAKDLAWIQEHAGATTVVDRSASTALIALQGPASAGILGDLTPLDLGRIRSFRFARGEAAGLPVLVSRTGYTGEDGFEIFVDATRAGALWDALMTAGAPAGLEPVGLGARDTLRLEAGLPLYGHELDDRTSPLAAGLQRWVRLDGEDFVGRGALLHEREQGAPRRLVGLALRGPGIARQGYPVTFEGASVGIVTSGTLSPTLDRAVALAYVSAALAAPGTMLAVDVRGRPVPAEVVPTPFYRRPRPVPSGSAETASDGGAGADDAADEAAAADPAGGEAHSEGAGARDADEPTVAAPAPAGDVAGAREGES